MDSNVIIWVRLQQADGDYPKGVERWEVDESDMSDLKKKLCSKGIARVTMWSIESKCFLSGGGWPWTKVDHLTKAWLDACRCDSKDTMPKALYGRTRL